MDYCACKRCDKCSYFIFNVSSICRIHIILMVFTVMFALPTTRSKYKGVSVFYYLITASKSMQFKRVMNKINIMMAPTCVYCCNLYIQVHLDDICKHSQHFVTPDIPSDTGHKLGQDQLYVWKCNLSKFTGEADRTKINSCKIKHFAGTNFTNILLYSSLIF